MEAVDKIEIRHWKFEINWIVEFIHILIFKFKKYPL